MAWGVPSYGVPRLTSNFASPFGGVGYGQRLRRLHPAAGVLRRGALAAGGPLHLAAMVRRLPDVPDPRGSDQSRRRTFRSATTPHRSGRRSDRPAHDRRRDRITTLRVRGDRLPGRSGVGRRRSRRPGRPGGRAVPGPLRGAVAGGPRGRRRSRRRPGPRNSGRRRAGPRRRSRATASSTFGPAKAGPPGRGRTSGRRAPGSPRGRRRNPARSRSATARQQAEQDEAAEAIGDRGLGHRRQVAEGGLLGGRRGGRPVASGMTTRTDQSSGSRAVRDQRRAIARPIDGPPSTIRPPCLEAVEADRPIGAPAGQAGELSDRQFALAGEQGDRPGDRQAELRSRCRARRAPAGACSMWIWVASIRAWSIRRATWKRTRGGELRGPRLEAEVAGDAPGTRLADGAAAPGPAARSSGRPRRTGGQHPGPHASGPKCSRLAGPDPDGDRDRLAGLAGRATRSTCVSEHGERRSFLAALRSSRRATASRSKSAQDLRRSAGSRSGSPGSPPRRPRAWPG